MALLFMSSCGDNYSTAQLPGPFAAMTGSGVAVTAGFTGNAIQITSTVGGALSVPNISVSVANGLGIGVRVNPSTSSTADGQIIRIGNTSPFWALCSDSGKLALVAFGTSDVVESSGVVLPANMWSYIEFFISKLDSTGTVTLKVNNATVATGTMPGG